MYSCYISNSLRRAYVNKRPYNRSINYKNCPSIKQGVAIAFDLNHLMQSFLQV